MLRRTLREKCIDNHNLNWEKQINFLINQSKDSKTFWSEIKLLKGKDIIHCNYIKDIEGNKYYSNKEKCNLMEKMWSHLFRITDEEEASFDRVHS